MVESSTHADEAAEFYEWQAKASAPPRNTRGASVARKIAAECAALARLCRDDSDRQRGA
jgi:hypothetical protein